jgi:hypothetical protein
MLEWLFETEEVSPEPAKVKPITQELKKRTLKVEYEDTEVDIGVTKLLLTFKGGRKLTQNIYGTYDQWVRMGNDEEPNIYRNSPNYPVIESVVTPFNVVNSLKVAQELITHNLYIGVANYVDDKENPTKSVVGEILTTRILTTSSFTKTVKVAKLVPNKES